MWNAQGSSAAGHGGESSVGGGASGGGALGKRKQSFSNFESKKPKKTSSHVTLTVNSDSKILHSTEEFVLKPSPVLYGGGRADSFAVKLPERSQAGFGKLADQRLTSTFFGQDCYSCPTMGETHGIHERRVFLLGDQFLPWRLGEGVNCVPVMRVEDANFDLMKQALLAQQGNGFHPHEGSVFVVGLLSHICRVGSAKFWADFTSFQGWAKANFGAVVWPVIPPFPREFPEECIAAIHNVMVGMQCRYEGDFHGRNDLDFCLWLPLDRMFNQLNIQKVPMKSEHFYIKGTYGEILAIGPKEGWAGFSTNFGDHYPQTIESTFWPMVLKEVLKVSPISLGIEIPDQASLTVGFMRCAESTLPAPAGTVPTVHLYGHSMAREVEGTLRTIGKNAAQKFNVTFKCLRAKPWEEVNLTVPTRKHKDDMIVLVGMGNCLFSKTRVHPKPDKMHLENPGYLGDQGAMEFIGGMAGVLGALSNKFSGTVYWAGPFPRHLADCCGDPAHHFPRSTVFKSNLHYVDLWNRFLQIHPKIRVGSNVSFIPFFELLGEKFYNRWLRDLVHFIPDINENFAQALANLPRTPLPLPDPLPSGDLSFTTWSMLQPVLRPASTTTPNLPQNVNSGAGSSSSNPPPSNITGAGSSAATTTATTTTTTVTTTITTTTGVVLPFRPSTASNTAATTTTTTVSNRVIPSIAITGPPANNNRPVGVVSSALSTMTAQERNQILTEAGLMDQS